MRTAKNEQVCIVFLCFRVIERCETIKPVLGAYMTGKLTDETIAKTDRASIIDTNYIVAQLDIGQKLLLESIDQCAMGTSVREQDQVLVSRRCDTK